MIAPSLENLTARLEDMELTCEEYQRECRLCKRLCAGLLTTAIVLTVAGAAFQRPKLVEAEAFHLVNSSGKPTAKLFNTPDGKPVLSFFNQDANVLNLGVSTEGLADMVFYDRAGKLRIGLILAEDNVTLGFYDPTRKSGIALSSANDGTSGIGLFMRDRKDRATIKTLPDGTGRIEIFGTDDSVVFQAPDR